MVKLSPRLAQIDAMITGDWQHIWDCCCDHGYLGMQLLARRAAPTIHFVDVVPALTAQVSQTLARFHPQREVGGQWQVHCADVGQLKLAQAPRQLVILAGVGGALTQTLVKGILACNPERTLDFLLCPVRQHYDLRVALAQAGLALVDEKLVAENHRFYEVLHLTTAEGAVISPVGERMWDFSHTAHRTYLANLVRHYQRVAQGAGPSSEAARALAAYQALQQSAAVMAG